mmetsp:Transcript_23448/g.41238  ORF Transcript_23448/g.41238 Transcript_23448/m.41238 type:complete len:328 (-) Transcript_23448:110-1093(-)
MATTLKMRARTTELPYGKTSSTVLESILDGIETEFNTTPDRLTLQQLTMTGVDEFHVGGGEATMHAINKLDIEDGDRILDIGCGLGGPARRIAHKFPTCTVIGIDMTPEYISVGQAINEWETIKGQLGGRVELIEGDVTNMKRIPSESIDKAYCLHVGMNIKHKDKLAKELYRVLKPGGRIIFFEQMANPSPPMQSSSWGYFCVCTGNRTPADDINRRLSYPVPWAYGPEVSHCATPQAYKFVFEDAGLLFLSRLEENRSKKAVEWMNTMQSNMMWHFATNLTSYPPPLSVGLLMGPDFKAKVSNYKAAVQDELLVVMELAFAKPFD